MLSFYGGTSVIIYISNDVIASTWKLWLWGRVPGRDWAGGAAALFRQLPDRSRQGDHPHEALFKSCYGSIGKLDDVLIIIALSMS